LLAPWLLRVQFGKQTAALQIHEFALNYVGGMLEKAGIRDIAI